MENVSTIKKNTLTKKTLKRSTKRLIFYVSMVTVPMFLFVLFYFYVNFDALAMAFKKFKLVNYIASDGSIRYKEEQLFVGFENFKYIIDECIIHIDNGRVFRQSIVYGFYMYLFTTVINTSMGLLLSYYIYKKYLFASFFRLILFLPSIISSVVLALLFKYIVNDVYEGLVDGAIGFMRPDTPEDPKFAMLLFYNVWTGFGGGVLVYTSTMSGINDSVVESAQLDGVSAIGEFFHITMPMIFPTFTTFLITGLAGILTNGGHLYTFYEQSAGDVVTLGYIIYVQTLYANMYESTPPPSMNVPKMTFPQLTALGLMITAITLPLVLGTKKLLEKFGPTAG
ncbi:MAG: sugar ABC transporter permease [Clostridia bacterium]|nr:sugar ABC transporter permease [Clostridia bacterium]